MTTTTALASETTTRTEAQTATKALKADIDRLREVRAAIKALESEKDVLTASILAVVKDDTKTITWGTTTLATLVVGKHVSHSSAILREAFPEAFEASRIERPTLQVR